MITDQHGNPQINFLFTSTAAKRAASPRKWGTWTAHDRVGSFRISWNNLKQTQLLLRWR
jgi:hypothetical protein